MKRTFLFLAFLLFTASELFAGPGGTIAKELFDTPIGKFFGAILAIIFLPFTIRFYMKQRKAIKGTKSTLDQLKKVNFELFDEINLKNRMTDVFTRVHKAWSERDLDNVDEYMTNWYSQNQQNRFLDEWDSKGLMNVCTISKVKSVKPIHIRLSENENFNGTRIMYAIEANMEDYLISVEDSSVLEGKKGFKDVETVWTMKLMDNVWKVDNIEQSNMISSYMKMESEVPEAYVENLIKSRVKA